MPVGFRWDLARLFSIGIARGQVSFSVLKGDSKRDNTDAAPAVLGVIKRLGSSDQSDLEVCQSFHSSQASSNC